MESLTAQTEPSQTKSPKPQDRVTLGQDEVKKVDSWLSQINLCSRGFLALSKADVVNFLIRQHKEEFLPKELLQIRADHYDPIRHINWITPQIKAALAANDLERVAELQEELRGVELSVIRKASLKGVNENGEGKILKRKRVKKQREQTANEADFTNENSLEISE